MKISPLLAIAAAAHVCASWPQAAGAAGPTFSTTYKGLKSGTSCTKVYNITGRSPDPAVSGPGPYPVFVFVTGTNGNYKGPEALRFVDGMAARGFVAASVAYPNTSLFQKCSTFTARSRCIFDQTKATSAVRVLCARAGADCSLGVVTAGFSQGSFIAVLARNYDARVEATYALGTGNLLSGITNLAACMNDASTALPSDRLVAIDGERDSFFGG